MATNSSIPTKFRSAKADLMGTVIEINSNLKSDDFILNIEKQKHDIETLQKIWCVRKDVYNKIYPDVQTFENDPYDKDSCVIYSKANTGTVTSTARIAFNGLSGIPEKALVPDLVDQLITTRQEFAELGRFVIDDTARGILKQYFRTFYEVGDILGVDIYIMFVRQKWVSFYQRLMKAEVIKELDETFGSDSLYSVMTWRLTDTTPRFFSWCGAKRNSSKLNLLVQNSKLGEPNEKSLL